MENPCIAYRICMFSYSLLLMTPSCPVDHNSAVLEVISTIKAISQYKFALICGEMDPNTVKCPPPHPPSLTQVFPLMIRLPPVPRGSDGGLTGVWWGLTFLLRQHKQHKWILQVSQKQATREVSLKKPLTIKLFYSILHFNLVITKLQLSRFKYSF